MATAENTTRTDTESIEALTAKCAMLSASLKQAEGQAAKTVSKLEDATTDCAALFDCYAVSPQRSHVPLRCSLD